jgi:hypothetical protein
MAAQRKCPEELGKHAVKMVLEVRAAARSWSCPAWPARSCRLSSVSWMICCFSWPMSSGWLGQDSR